MLRNRYKIENLESSHKAGPCSNNNSLFKIIIIAFAFVTTLVIYSVSKFRISYIQVSPNICHSLATNGSPIKGLCNEQIEQLTAHANLFSGDRYVMLSGDFDDGRRLGNQMFDIAAAVYVAVLTNRTFVMEKAIRHPFIYDAFDLSAVQRITKACPCFLFNQSNTFVYDKGVEELGKSGHLSANAKSIVLSGYFQSWKYITRVESIIRKLFTFRPSVIQFSKKYFNEIQPHSWTDYTKVAVHARRGDLTKKFLKDIGFTIPNNTYFTNAMNYIVKTFGRTQFIVLSDDALWVKNNIVKPESIPLSHINITYSTGHTAAQDLAIMSSCDHVIMSTGTYGWWGAFLANGTTIYYSNWPRNGSVLHAGFKSEDFFPPSWIGFDDEIKT